MSTESDNELRPDMRDRLIAILEASLATAWEVIETERRSKDLQLEVYERRMLNQQVEEITQQRAVFASVSLMLERLEASVKTEFQGEKVARRIEAIRETREVLREFGMPASNLPTPTVMNYLNKVYMKERSLQDDSKRHIINYLTWFAKITGDKPLGEYTRSDVVDYVRTLERLKNTLGKSSKDQTRSILDLLAQTEANRLPTMSKVTIEKHLTHVKAAMLAAVSEYNHASTDRINAIYKPVELSEFVPKAQRRKKWTVDQLNGLLATPIWTGTSSARKDLARRHRPGTHIYRDAYWWLPILALFSGARLEELAQLHHDDLLVDQDGIKCVRIHDEGDRRVKNKNSLRDVPIHPFLTDLGFLDLFKPGQGGAIFPELKPGGRLKKRGDGYSSNFTDYRRECGIYEPLCDFHSFRVSAITRMWELRIAPLSIARLVGHDSAFPELEALAQTKDYIVFEMGPLAEDISKLTYKGLDLEPLRRNIAKAD